MTIYNYETEDVILMIDSKFKSIVDLVNLNQGLIDRTADSLYHKIDVFNLNKIIDNLNESRNDLIVKLTELKNSSLFKNHAIVNFNLNESNYKFCSDLIGVLSYKNDLKRPKKLKYLNLFNFYNEIDFFDLKIQNFDLLTTIVISLDRFFFQFKSKNNLQDVLLITDKKFNCLFELKLNFVEITFSKYLSNKSFIISCQTNFKRNNHFLKLLDHRLKVKKERIFSFIVNLCLLTDNEIICFKPFEYMVMNLNLEITHIFGQYLDIDWPFYIESNCILGSCSIDYYFFKLIDELEKKILVRVVKKSNGKLVNLIEIESNDIYKCDYETNFLFIKNIKGSKLLVYDLNELECLKKTEVVSSQLDKFNFMDINAQNFFYSVNYLNKKISII